MTVLGAIIAGGQSRRFGADKAAALFAGKALIEHAIDALSPQIDALVIVGRTWGEYPSVDDHPFACGPLSGLCAALKCARDQGRTHVLTAGCDVLPIPPTLRSALEGDGAAVVAGQRLLGLWPSAMAEPLEAHIRAQSNYAANHAPNYALRHWIAISGARSVTLATPFHNLNTIEDLARFDAFR
jgi:molybdenum cofactor guanylyltransferase